MPIETVYYKNHQRGTRAGAGASTSLEDMRKNLPPPKRDFQEANPPKNLQELYARYDPSVGAGIAIALGSLLAYLMVSVAVKYVCKNIRRRLQKTKRFGRYFPEAQLPSLEAVQKLAAEQGLEIPESLLAKLKSASSSTKTGEANISSSFKNYKKRRHSRAALVRTTSNATTATTLPGNTPKSPPEATPFYPDHQQRQRTFNETEYYLKQTHTSTSASNDIEPTKTITVNIIGATPVPPDHHKGGGNGSVPLSTRPLLRYDPFMQIYNPTCFSADSNSRFVTTATVESRPLITKSSDGHEEVLKTGGTHCGFKKTYDPFSSPRPSSSSSNNRCHGNDLGNTTTNSVEFENRYYLPELMLHRDNSNV